MIHPTAVISPKARIGEGVEIGAWLPEEVQLTTRYAVALGRAAPPAARDFLDFLAQEPCRAVFDAAGFARP